jgi:PAS domain S-box-containing protein
MIRVLYVDDEPDLLEIGKIYLEEYGDFTLFIIDSAHACLALLKEDQFDAIISDYQMPGMDGIELLKHIRSYGNDIPFIIFTGRGREEVVIEALNSGADFYLQKGGDPVAQFAELHHKILSAIANHRAEQKIREKTEEMDKFFENTLDLLCIADTNGNLRRLSRQWETTLGFSRSDMEGKPFFSFVHPDDIASTQEAVAKLSAGEPAVNFVNRYLCKDGSYRWIEWRSYPVGTLLYATALDITDRIKAEDEAKKNHEELEASYEELTATSDSLRSAMDTLAEKEKLYRTLFHEMLNGFAVHEIICDKSGKPRDYRFLEVNEAFEQMTGLSGEKIIGRTVLEVMPETEISWIHRYGHVALTGLPDHFDNYSRVLDKYYEVTAYKNAPGQFTTIIADVTQRKLDENRILESERKYRNLYLYAQVALFETSLADAKVVACNQRYCDIFGFERVEDAIGKDVLILYANPKDREEIKRILWEQGFIKDHRVLFKNQSTGKEFWGQFSARIDPTRDIAEGTVIDIDERIRAETALRESEQKFRSITENAFDMISLLDLDGFYLYCNPSYTTILGYSPDEMNGINAFTLVHPDDRQSAISLFQQGLTDKIKTAQISLRLICKDGSYKWVDHRASLITDANEIPDKILLMGHDITEHKQAEMDIKKSEQKFRSLVEYSLEGILILDFSGNILFVNNAAAHMIEVDDSSVLPGRNVMEFILPESREDVIKDFILVSQGHDAYLANYHVISTKGKKFYVECIGKVITYEGKPADLLSIRDITKQQNAQHALQESSRKYAELFEMGSEAIFLIDNETGRLIEVNAAASEMYGYSRDTLLTLKYPDLSAEKEDTNKITTETPQGTTIRVPLRHHRRNDGTVFPVEILSRFFISNERPVHIAAIRDITERKQVEESLQESHDRFEQISGHSREMVWEIDPYGLYTYVSPACSEIIGYKPEELIKKKHFYDLHPEEGRELFRASTLEAFAKKKVLRDFLNPRQTKEGKIIWMSTNGMPVFDEFNNFLGYRGSDSDITEQKEAEKKRTRFGRILETSLNEIYFFDAQTLRFVDVNHGARENIGYTIDELRNMTPLDIITEYTKESFETLLSPLRTGEKDIQVIFAAHKRKDGSLYPIEVHLQLAGNEVLPVFVAIILDITERRQIEEALRLANWKLNLLSGITRHDINNQMTVLQGYLSLLEMKQTDPALDDYIQKMDASAKRISSMIQFTKEYEEIGITQPAWQDVRTIVTNAAKEISFGKIQLKNDLPVGMEVFSEPLIFKVFYNLMDNAVRYGDTITNIRFSVESRNGDRIIVCEDDGVGVTAIEKEKIFLRGFGKNTGLGLALSQEILEITGISIEECGEPGKGARFEMTVLKGMWRLAARTMGK